METMVATDYGLRVLIKIILERKLQIIDCEEDDP
jgi:hypothetical protein